ncbi:MAG: hypothetical protein CL524_12015 [Aequorivita sp.]|nr:hypothetical protein [Aequorivita sp.]
MKSLKKGKAARDAAMEESSVGANTAWKEAALDAIYVTAKRRDTLIVDDIWKHFHSSETTGDLRAVGPLMRVAQREGWIAPTKQFRPSYVPSHHATPRRVWKSKLK